MILVYIILTQNISCYLCNVLLVKGLGGLPPGCGVVTSLPDWSELKKAARIIIMIMKMIITILIVTMIIAMIIVVMIIIVVMTITLLLIY